MSNQHLPNGHTSTRQAMPKDGLTPTQAFYIAVFGESPARDIDADGLPELLSILDETLTRREFVVIKMRFGLDHEIMTRPQIGSELCLAADSIRKIEEKALRKLARDNSATQIRPLFASASELRAQIAERDKQINALKSELDRIRIENALLRTDFTNKAEEASIPPDSIGILGFSTRTNNCLRRAWIESIPQLIECYNTGMVLQCFNLGKKSLEEIEAALAAFGVKKTTQKPPGTVIGWRYHFSEGANIDRSNLTDIL